MDPLLLDKLSTLENTIQALLKSLENSEQERQKDRDQLRKLRQENKKLRQALDKAQAQVGTMIGQWFPELNTGTPQS